MMRRRKRQNVWGWVRKVQIGEVVCVVGEGGGVKQQIA